jgi:hypothetical protein
MSQTNFTNDMIEKAEQNFTNIKESIKGLYEILNINFSENDFYNQIGQDNLIALYQNLIELLLNEYGLRKIIKKLGNSELTINIPLKDITIEKEL